jgi:hypothetical protein
MRRRAFIGFALLALSHFTFANVTAALAQAGSTGGTIGKQDKSISGGVEVDTPRVVPHPKRSATKSQERSSGQSCDRIVGKWTWYLGVTETVFNQNGSVRNTANSGKWTCAGSAITISWINGYIDRMTISQDGKSLAVVSTWNGGTRFTATRRGQD